MFLNLFAQKVWYNDFKSDGAAVDGKKQSQISWYTLYIVILQISANHLDIDYIYISTGVSQDYQDFTHLMGSCLVAWKSLEDSETIREITTNEAGGNKCRVVFI